MGHIKRELTIMNATLPINDGGPATSIRDIAAIHMMEVIVARRLIRQEQNPKMMVNLRGEALAAYQLADALVQAKQVPFEPPAAK